MTYRDDDDALRSHVQALREELSEARRDIAALREAALRLDRKMGGTSEITRGAQAPCPQCGGSRLTPGTIRGQVAFIPSESSWTQNLLPSWGFTATRCNDCKHVSLFDR